MRLTVKSKLGSTAYYNSKKTSLKPQEDKNCLTQLGYLVGIDTANEKVDAIENEGVIRDCFDRVLGEYTVISIILESTR